MLHIAMNLIKLIRYLILSPYATQCLYIINHHNITIVITLITRIRNRFFTFIGYALNYSPETNILKQL